MQDGKAAHFDPKEIERAIDRIAHSSSIDECAEDFDLVGKALMHELKLDEAKTVAQAVHYKGLLAAQKFEVFVNTHFNDVKHFEKSHNEYTGQLVYDVILPRLYLNSFSDEKTMHEFSEILNEAIVFDIALEQEDPSMKGMIYLDIAFPTILRIKKKEQGAV